MSQFFVKDNSTSLADIETVTGNSGGAVGPNGSGNINLIGTATNGINVVGNPGTNTLTAAMSSPYADGDFTFTTSVARATRTLTVSNTDGTQNTSDAAISVEVGGSGAGDPYLRWTTNAGLSYALGIDNSASDVLIITHGATNTVTPSTGTTALTLNPGTNVFALANAPTFGGSALAVADGGTGLTNLTPNGVLVGNGVGNVSVTNPGSTGSMLVGVTGTDPQFTNSLTGDFTFTSTTAGGSRILSVSNTDNTNPASTAYTQMTVGGSSAGDPKTVWTVSGIQSWSSGLDNSDSDRYKVSASGALGTSDVIAAYLSGEVTFPAQPAFLANLTSTQTDVTGDGTTYTIVPNSVPYDVNSDYNSGTGTFTSPVTGKYSLGTAITLLQLAAGHTLGTVQVVTSNRSYDTWSLNVGAVRDNNNAFTYAVSVMADMDAADTATITVRVANATKTVDVYGAVTISTYFYGRLEG